MVDGLSSQWCSLLPVTGRLVDLTGTELRLSIVERKHLLRDYFDLHGSPVGGGQEITH